MALSAPDGRGPGFAWMAELSGLENGLPVTDPVLIVAIAFAVFLIAPVVTERLRVPGLVGVILAGAVIGPNGFNLLARDATIVLLGTVGLLYLMFSAGVEIDLHGFRRYRNRSIVFGALTFLVPQGLGTILGLILGYSLPAAILLASLFASHTLVAYPIAVRFGIAKTQAVTTAVGGTIITDTAALLVLAVVAASTEGALNAAFWVRLLVGLALYGALVLVALPRVGRWLFRHERTGATAELLFILAALFAGSYLAEVAGVEAIVGAFLVGLALNRLIPEHSPLSTRIRFLGETVFIPFFLLSVGMLVDARVLLGDLHVWQVMIAMTATVLLTKALAAKATQWTFGYSNEEGWTIFGLSVPQAAATLAATLVGYEIGLFDEAVLNGAILMILVTVVVGPAVVGKYGRLLALSEKQRPYQPSEAPQRVLVPLANPATADMLMDLALAVRHPDSSEPVFPLTVVPPGEPAGAQVAAAEKMLSHAVAYAAAADVGVVPLIRMDHNVASGIGRGIVERRASTIVIGWDGRPPGRQGIFGGVLDQLLTDTTEQLFVARLAHPLNTTTRLVVIIPRHADRLPGFSDSARSIKLLANRLGIPIRGFVVGAGGEEYERVFSATPPDAPVTMTQLAGWSALDGPWEGQFGSYDLILAIGARRGALAWTPQIETLPRRLGRSDTSLIMIYPSETTRPTVAVEDVALPRELLSPERVVRDLGVEPFEGAVRRILATAFSHVPAALDRICRTLVRREEQVSGELIPGVVLLHGHVPGLARSMLLMGTSADGIPVPGASQPAAAILILLTPEERPEEHLASLAAVARFVSDPARRGELLGSRSHAGRSGS